jgi:predicted TIM-barrel fold metal-dependent hydrolase
MNAQPQASVWGGPVLDIHLHSRQEPGGEWKHMEGCGVTHAILLTRATSPAAVQAKIDQHPGRRHWFASTDVTKPEAETVFREAVRAGAKGFGEIKFHVAADGSEMRRLYGLAGELGVPVLVHFQEVPHFEGEGSFSTGISRLPAILKEFRKTMFIGHADAFWANISADVPSDIAYPKGKVKPGGLTDRMLSEHPNLYGDLSANSGRNALARDPEFTTAFLVRHQNKLFFGSDCSCRDGHGTGQASQEPLIKGKCVARETLTALKQATTPEVFRKLTYENAKRILLKA